MNDLAIVCRNVSKRFWLRRNASRSLKSSFVGLFNHRYRERREEFWALKDVSFHVEKGEWLGVVGPNGAGKTTLIRILSGLVKPTEGSVEVHGKLAPMVDRGVGFSPELTGRENIYLNTSFYGMDRRQTDAVYQEIVDFSELGKFIEEPLKNYSAGMKARLGFAVSINLSPEILLLDEALSVGDAAFQKKCMAKIEDFKKQGKTTVFVSHGMSSIEEYCDRAIFIAQGKCVFEGGAREACQLYQAQFAPEGAKKQAASPRGGKNMKSVLIVLEGIDGTGKGTQCAALMDRLRREKRDAESVAFPNYESFFGEMVAEYLNGGYGGKEIVHPKLAALLYAMDRSRESRLRSDREILVLDRYVPSNLAHQGVKLPPERRGEFMKWIEKLEYEILGLPRPSLVIVLDADPALAASQILKKKKRAYTDEAMDIHERDTKYLSDVRDVFRELCRGNDAYRLVECSRDGGMRPVESIAEEIWLHVEKAIGARSESK